MADQTLSTRALRRIWNQLPSPARRRVIAQLIFLLRPIDAGLINEPICDPAGPRQSSGYRVRAPIDTAPGGTPSGEPASAVPAGRSRQKLRLASATLPGDRRRSGHLWRAEQQSTGLPAARLDGRPARGGGRLRSGGLSTRPQLPGLVPAAGVSSGVQRADRR
jgi:hypothetical protein